MSSEGGITELIFGRLGIGAPKVAPKVEGKELVYTITQDELDATAKKGQDPAMSRMFSLELHEGKMVIKIRM